MAIALKAGVAAILSGPLKWNIERIPNANFPFGVLAPSVILERPTAKI
jgi:hypothetical protein